MYYLKTIVGLLYIHITWASVLLVLTGRAGQGQETWDELTSEIPRFFMCLLQRYL